MRAVVEAYAAGVEQYASWWEYQGVDLEVDFEAIRAW